MSATSARSVAIVTLGCARNEVDSSEIAGRLAASGWELVNDPANADVAVVNTCGFIEAAKKDSVDALLEAADLKAEHRTQAVVAVGCMAERYGRDLADELPEADAVLSFDDYPDLSDILGDVLAGHRRTPHVPRDRRTLLPVTPVERRAAAGARVHTDLAGGPASGPPIFRQLAPNQVWAPLKLASGCDRRCSFCAIPAFRGAFISRHPDEVVTETRWLVDQGVREVFLVSENTTSYGKDLADLQALEKLLPRLAAVPGLERIRVSYLQPAEVRPGLIEAIATTDKVAAYFDLSFQHSAPGVLRRMRRFGSSADFLRLIEQVRALAPSAGIRSNVIVGFPGETEDDLAELHGFLSDAMLDVVGVFGYSDEDGTEAVGLDGHLDGAEIAERLERTTDLVEQLLTQRAEDRLGQAVRVIVEGADDEGVLWGRAEHQGPEVDGITRLTGRALAVGEIVEATVIDCDGVDLVAETT